MALGNLSFTKATQAGFSGQFHDMVSQMTLREKIWQWTIDSSFIHGWRGKYGLRLLDLTMYFMQGQCLDLVNNHDCFLEQILPIRIVLS